MEEAGIAGGNEWSAAAVAAALGLVTLVLAAAYWSWLAAEWAWFSPRRLERALRQQGIGGTRYRPIAGDLKEESRLRQEAKARPMPLLSHDLGPRVFPLLHRIMKEHGKFSITWVGPMPRVTIMDPDLIREVLWNKFGQIEKVKSNPFRKLVSKGLSSHSGEKWAMHRKMLNPAFHLEKLKCMLPEFSAASVDLMRRWESSIDREMSHDLDIWPDLQNFSADVISRTAFGSSYEEGRRIFELLRELLQLVLMTVQRIYIPGSWFIPTSRNVRMKHLGREMNDIIRNMVEKRAAAEAVAAGEHKKDLLGLLIETNARHASLDVRKGMKLTTEDVIEECKMFYFAGQETTSVMLTWTMVMLSLHPEWQAQAREEVLHVFGKNEPDFEGTSRLKIMTMILHEVLRLYPPIVQVARVTHKPTELGGITFPAGVMLNLPIVFLHHDREIWGEDAGEFRPDRFAEGVSNASKKPAQGGGAFFFPFGGGPRVCIGQGFALMEAKLCLSMILQWFAFELSPSYIHAPCTVITLQPQHGVQLRLRRI